MNQENITRTLATGQSDITRHEAYTKAQGLNEFNSLTPGYDHKQQITLHYCDIGDTRVLIDPQVKYKYGSNTPYCNIYDCGTCTTTNGTSILTLTYSGGKLQVYPYFFNPAEFNSSFEKVVDNVRYISTSVETPRPTYESIEDFMQQQVTITINDIEFTKEANSIYFVNNDVKTKGEAWSPEHINLYYVQSEGGNKIIVTKDGVMQISQHILQGYVSSDQTIRKYIPIFMVSNTTGLPVLSVFGTQEAVMVIDNIPNSNYAYTVEHFNNECNFVKNCAINSYYHINGLPSNMININYNDYLQLQEITTTIEDINGMQHSVKFNITSGSGTLLSKDIIFTCTPLPDDHKITIKLNPEAYIVPYEGYNDFEIAQDANGPLIFPYICGMAYYGIIDTSNYGGYVYYLKRYIYNNTLTLLIQTTGKNFIDSADPLLLKDAVLISDQDFKNSYIDIIIDGEPFYRKPGENGILLHRIYGTDYEIVETPDA